MKRITVLLLAFVLLFSVTAISESSKYESLSFEELVKERNAIEAEIAKRVGIESVIHTGTYVVGKHIKEGIYTITCLEVFNKDECTIEIHEGDNFEVERLYPGESTTVFLLLDPDRRNYLYIGNGTCTIVPQEPNWAP